MYLILIRMKTMLRHLKYLIVYSKMEGVLVVSGCAEVIPAVDTTPIIDGHIESGDKQMYGQMQHNFKVKAANEDCIIPLHRYYLLPFYLSFVDKRESRTTLHQGRDNDEHTAVIYMTIQQMAQFS